MLKVLVVDDEAPIRQWLQYRVDRIEGFAVCGAASGGQQALEIYRREKPDIVVTDIKMPGMDGLEMMQRMKELRPACMIVLTSHEDFDYARRALKQGATEYILKTELNEQYLAQILNTAGAAIRRRADDGRGEEIRRAERFLLRLASGEHRDEPLTESLARRQGAPWQDGLLFAADVWSRDGADLAWARRFAAEIPGVQNLVVAPLGHEHLLLAGNLQNEAIYLELVNGWQRNIEFHPFVVGLSDLCYRLARLPQALAAAQARCRLHFYLPEKRLLWQEAAGNPLSRHVQNLRAALSRELLQQNYAEALAVKDRALEELRRDRPTDLSAVKQLAADLAATLQRFTLEQDEEADRQIEQTEREIHSLSTVAAMLSFSPEHFSRMFVRETGMNFVTCLNNLRMKRAMELLEKTDKKIYEIAEEVGYSSVSYFSTAFKKSFGETPNRYQQTNHREPRDS